MFWRFAVASLLISSQYAEYGASELPHRVGNCVDDLSIYKRDTDMVMFNDICSNEKSFFYSIKKFFAMAIVLFELSPLFSLVLTLVVSRFFNCSKYFTHHFSAIISVTSHCDNNLRAKFLYLSESLFFLFFVHVKLFTECIIAGRYMSEMTWIYAYGILCR